MNTNGFSSSSGLQMASTNDRLKPLFQPSNTATEVRKDLADYRSGLSLELIAGESSGRQVFSKSIEFSLGVKFESTYEFKAPSPQDVASTVLGFVEKRINSEKQAGASAEKLNDLMAQAKSGIEKGYAQAEKDIKGLGLMTEELAEDISKGFKLINKGLENISDTISTIRPEQSLSGPDSGAVNSTLGQTAAKEADLAGLFSKTNVNHLEDASTSTASKFVSLDQFTESAADFVLNTKEGDQILIRMADFQALNYASNSNGESLGLSQSSRFEFSVKGSLNEDELQAINDVLEQVGNISSLFFNDQFEEAFNSALGLGFDSEQIASFSLDLSTLQTQEVRTYQESSKTALDSYKRNQPLVSMAQQFETLDALLEPLSRFEKVNSMIEALVSKAIEAYAVDSVEIDAETNELVNNYQLFSTKLMDSILLSDR
tara:strand:- start:64562 stop:65854 length:1293 start_codon:yes stop_codon:yes gene_type:complete